MRGKLKIIAGVVWVAVFLSIIFVLYSFSNNRKSNLKDEYTGGIDGKGTKLSGYIKDFLFSEKLEEEEKVVTKQQVVQEESAVIDVVEKVSPAVVSIVVKTTDFDFFSGLSSYEGGIGTGFIVDSKGIIVTNSHVVDNPNGEYSIVLKDGRNFKVDKIHLDENSDLAILEISARGLPVVELGDSNDIKVGQKAIAIGNALGQFSNTVTVGVISGIARELQASGGFGDVNTYEDVIQTDAALNPGNSGGPLLNIAGQVVGVNVATTYNADNISFAIPVNTLKPILEGFRKEGRIVKPYIGVSYQMITKEMSVLNNLPEGAYIAGVISESPADKAGLSRGDIIKKYNDKELTGKNTLSKYISASKVGDKIDLIVDRDGKDISITVTLGESPQNSQ